MDYALDSSFGAILNWSNQNVTTSLQKIVLATTGIMEMEIMSLVVRKLKQYTLILIIHSSYNIQMVCIVFGFLYLVTKRVCCCWVFTRSLCHSFHFTRTIRVGLFISVNTAFNVFLEKFQ